MSAQSKLLFLSVGFFRTTAIFLDWFLIAYLNFWIVEDYL